MLVVSDSLTITLPQPTLSRTIWIKFAAVNVTNLNIVSGSALIDGTSDYFIDSPNASILLQSDGTNWFILSVYNY